MSKHVIRSGQVITAQMLNDLAGEAASRPQGGWGTGVQSSGNALSLPGRDQVQLFRASEDFASGGGAFTGLCKLLWRIDGSYSVHGADQPVYAHVSGIEEGDTFAAFWNSQSGRWEAIVSSEGDDAGGNSHPCGCNFIPVGSVSCLTEAGNDAANRYVIRGSGLQSWLNSMGIVDAETGEAPSELIVEYDGDCTWVNLTQVLERECEDPTTTEEPEE